MLEHAAEPAHGIERRREASSVVAARVPVDVLNEAGCATTGHGPAYSRASRFSSHGSTSGSP
jgi:chorismate-pyruvate lyase